MTWDKPIKDDMVLFTDNETEHTYVKKRVKDFTENCGIAKQCCGKTVLAWKEPMKNGWFFMLDGQKWTASDYAFKE